MEKDNFKKIKKALDKDISFKNFFGNQKKKKAKPKLGALILLIVLVAIIAGGAGAALTNLHWQGNVLLLLENDESSIVRKDTERTIIERGYLFQITEEEKIIRAVEKVSPSVVSVVITKDVPILERHFIDPFGSDWPFRGFRIPQYREKGTERRQVGSGTGFIISRDGMILTNRHVLSEEDADYTVFLNDGTNYPVKILAKDPLNDLAVLQIDQSEVIEAERRSFFPMMLGDSSQLRVGQTVIAIGNALGEFQNTVSVGVVSGLGRNIVATGDRGFVEVLEDTIQTDAAINLGNSGGPLLNLAGEVIGINVARSARGENIGFSLPINIAKRGIAQVKEIGRIVYPFLGIHYTMITEEISQEHGLPVDYGAWIGRNRRGERTETAIFPGSPAQKVGLKRDDIILEFNAQKIVQNNSLARIIVQYLPGDKVLLKVLRGEQEILFDVALVEWED